MALATDGIWGDAAIVHGGWSWRQAYLGWRTWYGPLCYGWTDRIKHCIEQHIALGLVHDGPDKGALGHMLEQPNSVYYNMNEVFTDHVRQYFEYTNDVALMRKVFPVLKGIVEWESRRLQPGSAPLYESSLDTWISDGHWYIRGQCTTASAYMLGAHRLLADLAEALGKDPAPYRQKAESIRKAMQQRLWQSRRGVYAEYLDTLGARQLHGEPELATIYHSAEFAAANPLQIYEMLHWVDNHLRRESTPGGGRAYWSSHWFPNAGRSYTHSTYELAYGEQLNLALTNYLVGRADEAYAILRGVLCGIYNGPTPGGLSCHMYVNGRQRMCDEFADSISMWGRAVVEGMYGIRPKRPHGVVELSPQFPFAWSEASIKTPQFSYKWKRDDHQIVVQWESPIATAVELRLPLRAKQVDHVTVDGTAIAYRLDPGEGLTWLSLKSPAGVHGTICVSYVAAEMAPSRPITWKEGEHVALKLADHFASGFLDPQGVLCETQMEGGVLRGTVAGEPGVRMLFLKAGTESCPCWSPLTVRIDPRLPVVKKVWSPPAVRAKDLQCLDADRSGQHFHGLGDRGAGPGGPGFATAAAARPGCQSLLLEELYRQPSCSQQSKRCCVAADDQPGPSWLDARWNPLQEPQTGQECRRGYAGRRISLQDSSPGPRRRQRTLLDGRRSDLPGADSRGERARHARLLRRDQAMR